MAIFSTVEPPFNRFSKSFHCCRKSGGFMWIAVILCLKRRKKNYIKHNMEMLAEMSPRPLYYGFCLNKQITQRRLLHGESTECSGHGLLSLTFPYLYSVNRNLAILPCVCYSYAFAISPAGMSSFALEFTLTIPSKTYSSRSTSRANPSNNFFSFSQVS